MRTIPKKWLVELLLLALLCARLSALEWENPRREIKLAPLQVETEVVFPFVNRSSRTVNIRRLESNCDCLTVTADKTVVGRGESGRVKARFSVGDRTGTYHRSIQVETDEPGEPIKLVVQFEVPPPASVNPRAPEWPLHSPATPRVIEVRAGDGLSINFTEAVATSTQFTTRMETIEAGRAYRVIITPTSTNSPTSAAIRVRGQEKGGREIVVSAYAYVR